MTCFLYLMATRKDSSFQSSSLGRAQGARLNRESNASHESLTTHPLLSSTSSSGEIANGTTLPKYVPYTPRQRVTTTQVAVQPPVASFGSSQGGATPQLQLQNLKAAAQNIQLSPNSIGWAICEKLYSEGEKPEWEELWTALISNKVRLFGCLLLILNYIFACKGYFTSSNGSTVSPRYGLIRFCARPYRLLHSTFK